MRFQKQALPLAATALTALLLTPALAQAEENSYTITGMVYDAQHAPAAAGVNVALSSGTSTVQSAQTDQYGQYQLTGVASGHYSMSASADTYGTDRPVKFNVDQADVVNNNINSTMPNLVNVEADMQFADGTPAAGVVVQLRDLVTGERVGTATTTDANGVAMLTDVDGHRLNEALYELDVTDDVHHVKTVSPQIRWETMDSANGGPYVVHTAMKLASSMDAPLVGSTIDESNAPVAVAELDLYTATVDNTDVVPEIVQGDVREGTTSGAADGSFAFPSSLVLASGLHDLKIGPAHNMVYLPAGYVVSAFDSHFYTQHSNSTQVYVNGRVADASGQALVNAVVDIYDVNTDTVIAQGLTDPYGMYSLSVPSFTEIQVRAAQTGYRPLETGSLLAFSYGLNATMQVSGLNLTPAN